MKKRILEFGRRLLTPPVFAEDEKTQTVSQIYAILWIQILSITVIGIVLSFLSSAYIQYWLVLTFSTIVICLPLFQLAKRGHTYLSGLLLIAELWVIITIFAWTAAGIGTRAAWGYFIVVFIAGMLLGKKAAIITAGICSLTTLAIAFLSPMPSPLPLQFWLTNTMYLVFVILLQFLASRSIRELLAKTGSELRERLLAQAALFDSEKKHREMVNSLPFCVFEADLSGRLTFVNQTALEWFGYCETEFLAGMNVFQILVDMDGDRARENLSRLLSGQDLSYREYQVQRKDGSVFTVLIRSRLLEEGGKPVAVQGSLIDISERKQAEREREHSISLLKATLESTDDGILVVDLTGKIAHFNQRFVQMWQIPDKTMASGEDAQALTFVCNQLIDPQGFVDRVQKLYTDSLAESFDLLEFMDGRCFERYSQPQLLGGQPVGRVWSFRDITKRKQAENSLRYYSEFERLLAVISARFIGTPESMIDAEVNNAIGQVGEFAVVDRSYVFMFDQTGEFMTNTHEWCAVAIEAQKDNLQKLPLSTFPWWMAKMRANEEISLEKLSDLPPEAEAERKILEAQSIQSLLAVPIRAKDKLIGYLGFDSVRQVHSWPATSLALIRMVADIIANTLERKRAEKEISAWKQRFENVTVASNQIVYDYDFITGNIQWSGSIEKVLGYQLSEMNGGLVRWEELIAAQDRDEAMRLLDISIKDGTPYQVEYGFLHKNGHFVKIFDRGLVMQNAAGKPERMIGMMQDITERKHAEAALTESEHRYRTLFDTAGDSIFVMKDNLFFDCNSKTQEMFGCQREQIIGVSPDRFSPLLQPDGRKSQEKALEKIKAAYSGIPQSFEWLHSKADGTPFMADVSLSRFELATTPYLLAIVRNTADRKMLEEQLRQAQKMEAVGILAGGIAHDFNNILSTIVGYASLLQMQAGLDKKLKEYLERILASTERAASLTHSLLAFSRKQAIELQPVDINDAIFGFHKVLGRLIGEDIDFQLKLASESLVVDADIRQIEQVLMNLATNSRDAMPHGGMLTITTRSVVLTDGCGEIPNGSYAVISVFDSGTGMDSETQSHLFEPFYTTKEVGKGTGLGLAIVYGIVKNHQGFIKLESHSAQGTAFHLYLPLNQLAIQKGRRKLQPKIPRGTETILLVEDDAAVRHVTKSMLEEFGYTVLEAADGQKALALFAQHRNRVHLLLSDLIMPKKNGRETRDGIMKLKPDIKTIFMSGYTSDIIARKGILEPGTHLLFKPLHPAELLNKIRAVLDS